MRQRARPRSAWPPSTASTLCFGISRRSSRFSRRPRSRSRRLSAPPAPVHKPRSTPFRVKSTARSGASTIWCRALIVPLSRLRTSAIGNSSIMAVRRVELEATAEGRRLTVENSALSIQLSNEVAALVAGSQRGIATATEQTRSVQKFGRVGLLAVVALSLISSGLIVWLYVGRNIVARLTALSDRMLALARGDLKSPLPQGGTDEIGRMADALGVFRATANEMEETNLKEIRETRARLTDAIETISEGFSLYDADDKLIICNSHYREL